MKATFIPLMSILAMSTLISGCNLHPYAGTAPQKSGAEELYNPKYVQLYQLNARWTALPLGTSGPAINCPVENLSQRKSF